ncbi:sensor histidine kinase [Hasllibacter sp. MH4015]|uniref:sensor histidine kinase n=1 Tax=Hasllibacter sp. MH4015 TaxID=2854029 RepID=UPI001CD68679|nr:PAS domain-containing sensor histidine kinase [Hasllibacter sp. MH4015]
MLNKIDFQVLFERSPAPTMILDKSLRFVAANPAYLKMVGRTWDDLDGTYVFDAFPEAEDRVRAMKSLFEATLEGEETVLEEVPFRITVKGVSKEEWWTVRHASLQSGPSGEPFLIQFSENVSAQVRMREMRNAMMGELQHRMGNTFSIVFALARQVGRTAATIPDFLSMFEGRLRSLVSLNKQLGGSNVTQEESMAAVVDHQLAVYGPDVLDRISVSGDDYSLSMLQSQAVAMAIHELATNSLKYGAIGQEGGAVSVTWTVLPSEGCLLTWEETGIEVAEPAEKTGYGTMLLTTIIPSQLNGNAAREVGADTFK